MKTGYRRSSVPFLFLLLCLAALPAGAREVPIEIKDVSADLLDASAAAKSITSRLFLLGGPLGNGDFEQDGLPYRDGWITKSEFLGLGYAWHPDTHGAAGLDPGQPGNHAYWCGTWFPSCPGGGELQAGYGNNWRLGLTWNGAVPDPGAPVTVRLQAVLTHDLEAGYDYLYLEVRRGSAWERLDAWTGTSGPAPIAIDRTVVLQAGELGGPNGDAVNLRFVVDTDAAWSDEDCLYDSEGAARLDNLRVYFDQGSGQVLVSEDDAEPATERDWAAANLDGSNAEVWADLPELGECWAWDSPVLGFIAAGANGEPAYGSVYTYGPDGMVVHCPARDDAAVDYMVSPVVVLPADWKSWDGTELEFDAYQHQADLRGAMVTWEARTSNDGGNTWTGWQYNSTAYFTDGITVGRFRFDLTSALWPVEADRIQVRLGVRWAGSGNPPDCSLTTPAPWYDNVSLSLVERAAPSILASSAGIREAPIDGFPAAGGIDPDDLSTGAIAWNAGVGVPDYPVKFRVAPSRPDVPITAVELHWRLRPNPTFAAERTQTPPNPVLGYAEQFGEYIFNRQYTRYRFDLPDAGFLFAGDVLQFYIVAEEVRDGVTRSVTMPADTTGVDVFPGDPGYALPGYAPGYGVRALPSVTLAGGDLDAPDVLVWVWGYRFPERPEPESSEAWRSVLASLGWEQGRDYDFLYKKSDFDPGLAIVLGELSRYRTIVVDAGEDNSFPANVQAALDTWRNLGDRRLLVFGADALHQAWLNTTPPWFGTSLVYEHTNKSDVRPLIGDQASPAVAPAASDPLGLNTMFTANSRCRWADFDAFLPAGDGVRFWEFLDPAGQPDAFPYAAGVLLELPSGYRGVAIPFPLTAIEAAPGMPGDPLAVRTQVIGELFAALGVGGSVSGVTGDVPGPAFHGLAVVPNPFNPRTELRFTLDRASRVEASIYDARGRRVRNLKAGTLAAGPHILAWDGTDHRGRSLPTGLYLAVVAADGQRQSAKLMLVR